MENYDLPQLRFRYKYIFAIVGVFIAGLVLLISSQSITIDPKTNSGMFWKLLCEQLATAMLVGSFTGGLYEYFIRREFLKSSHGHTEIICSRIKLLGDEAVERAARIADFFSANAEQRELGISHCYKEVDRYDFTDYIEGTKNLVAVLNDGRGWVGNYYQRFVNRFALDHKQTTIILMHPNSPALAVHATKVGSTAQGLRIKIAETVRLLHKANVHNRPIRILGHHYYNTMTVFFGESDAIITPYFLSKVRRTPPLLTFTDAGRESFYHKLKEDIDALLIDCTDISSYVKEDGSLMTEAISEACE